MSIESPHTPRREGAGALATCPLPQPQGSIDRPRGPATRACESCLPTQTDGAVGMRLLLLTVGLALVGGLQAQEQSLQEVSTRGPAAPRPDPEGALWTAGGLPRQRQRPSGGRPGSRTGVGTMPRAARCPPSESVQGSRAERPVLGVSPIRRHRVPTPLQATDRPRPRHKSRA